MSAGEILIVVISVILALVFLGLFVYHQNKCSDDLKEKDDEATANENSLQDKLTQASANAASLQEQLDAAISSTATFGDATVPNGYSGPLYGYSLGDIDNKTAGIAAKACTDEFGVKDLSDEMQKKLDGPETALVMAACIQNKAREACDKEDSCVAFNNFGQTFNTIDGLKKTTFDGKTPESFLTSGQSLFFKRS